MDYEQWQRTLPETVTGDSLWRQQAYRLALFAARAGWEDTSRLARNRPTAGVADQLFEALGSVGANIAEGYSRGAGADRARFFEYALGSAREARHWYCTLAGTLPAEIVSTRLDLLARIIRLLLVALPRQRGKTVRRIDT